MTPEQIAAMFGPDAELVDVTPAKACCWCGKGKVPLTWRTDHWTCETCWQGGGGEYPEELTLRVSRGMERGAFAKLRRNSDGAPILPSLTNRAWRKLTGR